ncbi:MAG: cupin domain-containing protein [Methylophilaceae bacterium]|nr:MAG: cupin domain-containing protein [Methylophilaceae bacterium]
MKHLLSMLWISFLIPTLAQSADAHPVETGIKVTQILKATKQWDGSLLPPYPLNNPEITILQYEIAPGTKLPMHKHPVINAGMMLEGELTVNAEDGKQLILKAGDTIVELVDKWHFGINQGTTTAKLIVFYVGEVGVPLSF